MKIRQTRQVDLAELIRWAWENKIKDRRFPLPETDSVIGFDRDGTFFVEENDFNDQTFVEPRYMFNIDEQIEVNEKTVLDRIIAIDNFGRLTFYENQSIAGRLKSAGHKASGTKFIYVRSEDDSIGELLWAEGSMAEEARK